MKNLFIAVLLCTATSVSADCSGLESVRKNIRAYEQFVEGYERSVAETEGDCERFYPFSDLVCEQEEKDKRHAKAYRAELESQRKKLWYLERLCAGQRP